MIMLAVHMWTVNEPIQALIIGLQGPITIAQSYNIPVSSRFQSWFRWLKIFGFAVLIHGVVFAYYLVCKWTHHYFLNLFALFAVFLGTGLIKAAVNLESRYSGTAAAEMRRVERIDNNMNYLAAGAIGPGRLESEAVAEGLGLVPGGRVIVGGINEINDNSDDRGLNEVHAHAD